QRKLIAASFLSCALDAFDFFALVFVLRDIALEFSTSIKVMTIAILLTIIMRPIGGLLFQSAATRYGWRPTLLFDVLLFIGLEMASASALSSGGFLVVRAMYGVAMGGEWRVGATLGMNSIPEQSRGVAAGIIQAGYAAGYLGAALALFILYPVVGWRG